MGVRQLAAREGTRLLPERKGELFEHVVGLELIRLLRLRLPAARLRFWRDPDGPEVDWVVEHHGRFPPIEVKLTDRPSARDTRHLAVCLDEYRAASGLVICTEPRKARLSRREYGLSSCGTVPALARVRHDFVGQDYTAGAPVEKSHAYLAELGMK